MKCLMPRTTKRSAYYNECGSTWCQHDCDQHGRSWYHQTWWRCSGPLWTLCHRVQSVTKAVVSSNQRWPDAGRGPINLLPQFSLEDERCVVSVLIVLKARTFEMLMWWRYIQITWRTRQVEPFSKQVECEITMILRKQVLQYDDVIMWTTKSSGAERCWCYHSGTWPWTWDYNEWLGVMINRTQDGHSCNDQEEVWRYLNFAWVRLWVPENAWSLKIYKKWR